MSRRTPPPQEICRARGSKSKSPGPSTQATEEPTGDDVLPRRRFLKIATGITAALGASAAAYPFLESLLPSAKARAEGGPVTVDLGQLAAGEQTMVTWRGKPVRILHRTAREIESLSRQDLLPELRDPASQNSQQPDYARNAGRSRRPEFFVCVASCTHLGCIPLLESDLKRVAPTDAAVAGYFCPCHGSRFDLAGRVFRDVPAPTNLVVPPYYFAGDDKVVIGRDGKDGRGRST